MADDISTFEIIVSPALKLSSLGQFRTIVLHMYNDNSEYIIILSINNIHLLLVGASFKIYSSPSKNVFINEKRTNL